MPARCVTAALLMAAAPALLGVSADAAAAIEKDYCAIGAGPAGCQLGFFWEQTNRDYVILEKADGPGAFYRCVSLLPSFAHVIAGAPLPQSDGL